MPFFTSILLHGMAFIVCLFMLILIFFKQIQNLQVTCTYHTYMSRSVMVQFVLINTIYVYLYHVYALYMFISIMFMHDSMLKCLFFYNLHLSFHRIDNCVDVYLNSIKEVICIVFRGLRIVSHKHIFLESRDVWLPSCFSRTSLTCVSGTSRRTSGTFPPAERRTRK